MACRSPRARTVQSHTPAADERAWSYLSRLITGAGRRRRMASVSTGAATLRVELEDVGGTSWWAGRLSKVVSPSGHTQVRFVGYVEGQRRRYRSSTFRAPRTLGVLPPQEQWDLGMILS